MRESEPLGPDPRSAVPDEQTNTNLSRFPANQGQSPPHTRSGDTEPLQVVELREEQLVAHKNLVDLGEVVVRTMVAEVPGRLEVDALREEAEIEHVPVSRVVSERRDPYEEDGALVIPIYEEQLVVTKRLVLREELRVRRIGTTERQVFEDTLRKERLIVEDPNHTGLVHEVFPKDEQEPATDEDDHPGLLEQIVRRAVG